MHSPILYLLLFLIPLVHIELQYITEKNADKLTYMLKSVGKNGTLMLTGAGSQYDSRGKKSLHRVSSLSNLLENLGNSCLTEHVAWPITPKKAEHLQREKRENDPLS